MVVYDCLDSYQVSVPERSKGVDSSSTVFALVGSNPTADIFYASFRPHPPLHGTSQLQQVTSPLDISSHVWIDLAAVGIVKRVRVTISTQTNP